MSFELKFNLVLIFEFWFCLVLILYITFISFLKLTFSHHYCNNFKEDIKSNLQKYNSIKN